MSQSKEEQLFWAAFYGDLEKVTSLGSDPALNINWQDKGGFTPLFGACQAGHVGVVKYLLSLKGIDPNKPNKNEVTPFFMACQNGHKEMVSRLLADPRIDPNKADDKGATPFFVTCQQGHEEVISLLLADPRIDPNKPQNNQSTPLWMTSQNGHLVIVQLLLASGREIDTKMKSTFNNTTAAEQGRAMGWRTTKKADETKEDFQRKKINGPLCADLIDGYEGDPVTVRYRLRRQPGLREYFIGHLFALVIFHSDNFVVVNERIAHFDTRRFFLITSRLPLEIQMIIGNQIFGSPKDIILSRDSEPGFECLTRTTTWQ